MRTVETSASLSAALQSLADDGALWPCAGNGWLWTSDDAKDRARAVQACGPCPIRDECAAEADRNREQFGVWGARDRTSNEWTTRARTAAAARTYPTPKPVHLSAKGERYRDELLARMADFAQTGRPWDDVGDVFDATPATLERRCLRLGITAEVRAMFPNGWSRTLTGMERERVA